MTEQEELDNKFLFSYMKNNEDWRTSMEDGKTVYHNPLNASAYGLLFHTSEIWLNAVEAKLRNLFFGRGFKVIIEYDQYFVGFEEKPGAYCLTYVLQPRDNLFDNKTYVSHIHNPDFHTARLKLLSGVIKTLQVNQN